MSPATKFLTPKVRPSGMTAPQMKSQQWYDDIQLFLRHQNTFQDCCHDLSWRPLRTFLEYIQHANPYNDTAYIEKTSCRILLDQTLNGKRRRAILTDKELFKEKFEDAERKTFFITDISPFCAAILGTRETLEFVNSFRTYIQRHLMGQSSFHGLRPRAHNACPDNDWPRHYATGRKFTYEFHLHYLVLRERREVGPDYRKLRKWYPLIAAFDSNLDDFERQKMRLACYEAQVSLLVIGSADDQWKAYCNTDAWFDDGKDIQDYIDQDLEAPAGDGRKATKAVKNPREYFLMVLAHRMRQIGHEWGNISTAILSRLPEYEENYLRNVDSTQLDLHDDRSMTRTRSYLKAAAMCRQFHDLIMGTIRPLDAFMKSHNDDLFARKVQDDFEDSCGCYGTIIEDVRLNLLTIAGLIHEKMLRFESMRDSILTASMLRENQQTASQGRDVELLTKVTVVYLPAALAATLFGMSDSLPPGRLWVYWGVVMTILAGPTFWSVWRQLQKRRM